MRRHTGDALRFCKWVVDLDVRQAFSWAHTERRHYLSLDVVLFHKGLGVVEVIRVNTVMQ